MPTYQYRCTKCDFEMEQTLRIDDRHKPIEEAHKYGTIGGYGGEMSHYIEVTDSDYDLLREVDKLLSSQQ